MATRRTKKTETSSTSAADEPSRERIEQRAYEIYLERGGTDGMDLDDWLQAERELRAPTERRPAPRRKAKPRDSGSEGQRSEVG